MAVITFRENAALDINPPSGNEELSTNGSDWLWAATAVYVVSFLVFFGTSFFARNGEKVFHYIFSLALLVGSITYFAQAAGLGYVVTPVVNAAPTYPWTREILYPKYINWVVSFPSVILSLGLLSGVPWATIIYNIGLSWIWVISYLVAAFTDSQYKWGFYAFGTIAWVLLAFSTLYFGHSSASRVGVARDHSLLNGWVNFLWLIYPIAWGISDGGNKIGVTPGAIFFGVLDILLVPVLAFIFYALSSRWDYNQLNLAFTRYGRVQQTGSFPEKTAAPADAAVAQPAV